MPNSLVNIKLNIDAGTVNFFKLNRKPFNSLQLYLPIRNRQPMFQVLKIHEMMALSYGRFHGAIKQNSTTLGSNWLY